MDYSTEGMIAIRADAYQSHHGTLNITAIANALFLVTQIKALDMHHIHTAVLAVTNNIG